MKKKLACVLAAAMLMGILSACGSSEGSSDGKKKELVVWNAGIQTSDTSGELTREKMPVFDLIEEFESTHHDYKVTLVDYDMDNLNKAFTSANMAKQGPDMVAIWAGSTTLAYQDYLIDFSEYLTEEELQEFDTSSLLHKNNTSQEAFIGMPYGLDATGVLYYNTEIFEQYNLEVPETWSELIEVSEQLKAEGVTPMIIGDKDGYCSTWAVCSMLGNIMGPDGIRNLASGGSVPLTGEEFTTALTTWKEYVDAGYTNVDYLTKSDGDAITDFVQGKGAMLLHGNWACSDFEAMGDKVDLTRIPALDGTDYMDYMYSQPNINLIIPSCSENIEAAVDLCKMLSSTESTEKSNEALYSKETAARLSRKSKELTGEGKNVTGFDSIVSGEAANEFYKLVPTYLKGSITLEDFTAKLQELN